MEDDPESGLRKVLVPGKDPIKITKWKVRKGTNVSKGVVLAIYETLNTLSVLKNQKLKSLDGGIVQKIAVSEGEEIAPGSVLVTIGTSEVEQCSHPTVMKDMCALCGADLRHELGLSGDRKEAVAASVAMVHSIPELIVSEQQALELGQEDENRLLKTRKLVLLVDLDQTLIHTTNDNIPPKLKDVCHFQLWHGSRLLWYHTKFRPYTRKFLENIAQMYELHICTFGVRLYAHTIARLLDPDEKFFSHRILSRDECFSAMSKTANLKALFPCGDSMVCIIDDREDVWNFSPNLIHVKPYRFFQGTADINAPPGCTKTENDDIPVTHRVRRPSDSVDGHEGETKGGEDAQKSKGLDDTDNSKDVSNKGDSKGVDNIGDSKGVDNIGDSKGVDNIGDSKGVDNIGDSKGVDNIGDSKGVDNIGDSKGVDIIGDSKGEGGKEEQSRDVEMKDDDNSEEKSSLKDSELKSDLKTDLKQVVSDNDKIEATEKIETGDIKETLEKVQVNGKEPENNSKLTDNNVDGNENRKDSDSANVPNNTDNVDNTKQNEQMDKNTDIESASKSDNVQDTNNVSSEIVSDKEASIVPVKGKDEKRDSGIEDPEKDKEKEVTMECAESPESQDVEKTADEDEVEWEDEDDYLYHLEEILTRIHKAFYDLYDQTKSKGTESKLPNLKDIIPYVKRKVLKGCNIVFSGVVPLNMPPEKCRAYIVARALGANIQNSLIPRKRDSEDASTHLVAAKPGTAKVNSALKMKGVCIVNVNWLWSCAERWERVEEKLFPLTESGSSKDASYSKRDEKISGVNKRKSEEIVSEDTDDSDIAAKKQRLDGDCDDVFGEGAAIPVASGSRGPKKAENTPFLTTFNPLLSFSDADLEFMDKEVDEFMDEDSDSGEDEDDVDRNERIRQSVLGDISDSSTDQSLAGDTPRGWNIRKKSPSGNSDQGEEERAKDPSEESDTELESYEKTIQAFSADNSQSSESGDSIGSVDDEIADAVEKEFLSLL